jgi:NAD-dependent DNA ligase
MTATSNRIQSQAMNQLMGICSGLVCDGKLSDEEIVFLSTWAKSNVSIARDWPASTIYRRVEESLRDGVITEEERRLLLTTLQELAANDFVITGSAMPDGVPNVFDEDPHVIIPQNVFCFTGEFLFGTRAACHRAVESRRGLISEGVTTKTNYLVIGARCSPAWFAANFGRKIQKAAEMAGSGDFELAIVREQDWSLAL